ncbi:MAG: hypothetical protein O3B86_11650 [Planctomycetota bacterium]|nr:hypothetical protein [Planctomycetota bacterium]
MSFVTSGVFSPVGGAVGMNIDCGTTPLVLLCPAWEKWGRQRAITANTVVQHSKADDVGTAYDGCLTLYHFRCDS